MISKFIIHVSEVKLFRVFVGVTQLLWGVWLLSFSEIFSNSRTFDFMAQKATQEEWGYSLVIVSIVYLHALWYTKAYIASNVIRVRWKGWYYRIASYLSLLFWFLITGGIVIGNYQGTGAVVYSMITLFLCLEIVREI